MLWSSANGDNLPIGNKTLQKLLIILIILNYLNEDTMVQMDVIKFHPPKKTLSNTTIWIQQSENVD